MFYCVVEGVYCFVVGFGDDFVEYCLCFFFGVVGNDEGVYFDFD